MANRRDLDRVQDVGLAGADDSAVLAWAVGQGRVRLPHDVETVTRCAFERVDAGLPMSGVMEIVGSMPMGAALLERR